MTVTGVTITGGVAISNPTDPAGTRDFGGGIAIPWAANGGTGATVTISDSVVTGNRASPTTTTPSGSAQCPSGPCAFARGDGGGVGNYGNLTLIRTTLSNNVAGDRRQRRPRRRHLERGCRESDPGELCSHG